MQLGALVADANGRTRGERCGLPPTWLSATAGGLKYAHCRLSGQGTEDKRPPSTLW